jgi:hypothetical protein
MPKNTHKNTHPPFKNNSIIIIIPVTTFSQGTKKKEASSCQSGRMFGPRKKRRRNPSLGCKQARGMSGSHLDNSITVMLPVSSKTCREFVPNCLHTDTGRERENTKARKTLNPELRVSRVLLPTDLQTTLK